MLHGVATAQNMAFTNNSRSFANLGNGTFNESKTGSSTPLHTSANSSKPWGGGSIWGNGSLTNGFNSKNNTRDNSRSRDSAIDEVHGKTGSGSLVDSSVSDDWSFRSHHGQRSSHSSRSISQVRGPDSSASSTRNLSTAGLSQTAAAQSTYSSRPPTVNLNSTTSALYRPSFGSVFTNERSNDQPPNVYTKFDRPTDPSHIKKPDSAIVPWAEPLATPSPTDERRPFTFGTKPSSSLPESRNPSQPPSRHDSDAGYFTNPDFSQRSMHSSASSSSRAPSMSSQRNGNYTNTFSTKPGDTLTSQLGQLRINNADSRPSTSYRSSSIANAFSGSQLNATSSRPGTSGTSIASRADDDYALERYSNFHDPNPYGSRFAPNPGLEFRNGQPAIAGRSFDMPGLITPADWPIYGNSNRRSPATMDGAGYYDPRIHHMLAAQMQLRQQYAMYGTYGMAGGLPVDPAYLPMMPLPLHGLNGATTDLRDPNAGDGVQSALMYEFKSNTKSKRYELKDIYDHIAEFSGDQLGSRFIQTKLETANSDEKERVFREIEPNTIPLMTDVFGNYVIQKFFEHGDQTHKKILASKMRGQVLSLSLQMYGCRVVQKALDHVLVDQQAQLIGELEGNVLKCVKDQNGNHVIQKAIERCPAHTIGFIVDAFRGQVQHLSIHPYGCRVIQRCLERGDTPSKTMIMSELMDGIQGMISDQYGNYVVQHIVAKDEGAGRQRVLQIVSEGLEGYSKHKFASNVVEKCLEQADERWRRDILYSILASNHRRVEGEGLLVGFLKDNYGNYVIQKLLDTLSHDDYLVFIEHLHPAVNQAKRTGCGKQILSIEKKMHKYDTPNFASNPGMWNAGFNQTSAGPFQAPLPTPPFSSTYGSVANTPPLATPTELSNVHYDAVEGAPASRKGSEAFIYSR